MAQRDGNLFDQPFRLVDRRPIATLMDRRLADPVSDREAAVDDFVFVMKDFQPAAIIVIAVAVVSILSGMTVPQVGPWVSMLSLAAVTVYVGNRVLGVDARPAWLLPLTIAGTIAAAGAGFRVWRAMHARSNNDRTIAYVFPTALAIVALWLSIALIELDRANVTAAVTG